MKQRARLFFLMTLTVGILSLLVLAQAQDSGRVYRVGILPFLIYSQENLDYLREGIHDVIASRITAEGRILVIERSLMEQALYEERPMRLDETAGKRIGARVGADYVILGSITKIGNYISLDARLVSVTEEKPPLSAYTQHKGLEDVMVKIGEFAQEIELKILGRRAVAGRPAPGGQSYIIRTRKDLGRIGPEGLAFRKSQTFDFEIKGLDVGDVDGDGKNEVVIMDNSNVYVFKFDGERLSLMNKIETAYGYNLLTLDVADVNGNGHAEIIVTGLVEDDLRSFILEYEEKKLRKIMDHAPWFFRVLEHPKDGPLLMAQRMGSEGVVDGPIYQMVWKKKAFERGPKMPFPKASKIFGLTLGEVRGEGKLDAIFIDDQDRLNIVSGDGKWSWRSRDRFGGTDISYDTGKKRDMSYSQRDKDARPWRVYIPARILVRDLDRDGVNEIIVNNNQSSTLRVIDRVRMFSKGEIVNLLWDGANLSLNWKTREINGYLSDFQVKDADNDGEEDLVVASIDSGNITDRKGTSNIYFFRLD